MLYSVLLCITLICKTIALQCDRSTVYNGVPCTRQGVLVSKADCSTYAPRCCEFSVASIHCFVNKNHNGNTANNDQCNFKHQLNSIMPVAPANRVASGPLLTTHYVVSQLQCMDYCARNVHCYAFNYEIEPRNVKRRRCELLSGIDGLEHRQRYTHQIMDHERFRDTLVQNHCSGKTIDPNNP